MATILPSSCRLCLNVPAADSLVFSVYDTYQGRVLSQLIDELFAIKVHQDDRLLSLCIECVNRINSVHKIKQQFLENDRKLQQLQRSSPVPGSFVEELVYAVFTSNNDESAIIDNTTLSQAEQLRKPIPIEPCTTTRDTSVSPDEDTCDLQAPDLYDDVDPKEESAQEISTICSESKPTNLNDGAKAPFPRKHTVQMPKHKCYFCGSVFENSLQFTNHLPSHFSEVPYTCRECNGLVFKTVREASRHIGFHDQRDRPFQCRVCTLRFPTRTNSLTHERKLHRWKLKRMEEKVSMKNESSNRRLVSKEKSTSCKEESSLKRQTSEHKCEICNKKFTAKKNLTRHLMIHTGEKPFKCEQCGQSFRQAGELKRHSGIHQKHSIPNITKRRNGARIKVGE